MTQAAYTQRDKGVGWITFASLMLGFAGTLTLIDGIVALAKSKFYVGDAVYVFGDVRTWGWILLIVGVLELLAAFAVFGGGGMARWFGIGMAALNGVAQLMFMPAYPWWAMAVFAIDVLIIYALVAYGGVDYADA